MVTVMVVYYGRWNVVVVAVAVMVLWEVVRF